MNRVKLQGRAPTLRDQQRAAVSRSANYTSVDFDALGKSLEARQFVGPLLPARMHQQMQPDVLAEREARLFWKLAAEIKRYGHVDFSQTGTPRVGDAFGFGQSTNEVYA